MQGYFTHTSLQMTRFYLFLACFDRYAISSSNAQIRRFGKVTVARRMVPIVMIFCWLFFLKLSKILVCYLINHHQYITVFIQYS
jgi:hypothetical protein